MHCFRRVQKVCKEISHHSRPLRQPAVQSGCVSSPQRAHSACFVPSKLNIAQKLPQNCTKSTHQRKFVQKTPLNCTKSNEKPKFAQKTALNCAKSIEKPKFAQKTALNCTKSNEKPKFAQKTPQNCAKRRKVSTLPEM